MAEGIFNFNNPGFEGIKLELNGMVVRNYQNTKHKTLKFVGGKKNLS
jgi:hypothetical protein